MKYCADCTWLQDGGHRNGMFPCENRKSGYQEVSAKKTRCDYFLEILNSKRGERRREELMRISKEYHCYIVTAIVTTLIIDDCLDYLNAFDYYRGVILPLINGGDEWLEDYDTYGPIVAEAVEGDEDKCSYLFETYVKPFTQLLSLNQVDAAKAVYDRMYVNLKEEYNIGTGNRKLEYQAS